VSGRVIGAANYAVITVGWMGPKIQILRLHNFWTPPNTLPGKSERREKEVDTDGTRLVGSDFLLTLILLKICSFVAEMFAPPYKSKEKLTTDGRTPRRARESTTG